MSCNRSTRSNPSAIPEGDEPEHLMKRTDAPNELSHRTARASRKIIEQQADIIDAWAQALKDGDHHDVGNVDDNIMIADEELEIDCKRADTTKYQT